MIFFFSRAVVLSLIGLPVVFVMTSLVIVALGFRVEPHIILPWAASLAALIAVFSGRSPRNH
ncbi:MAG: hypothetical protein CMK07_10330 [Ponticaulis sp.]|nr:hypothetical protein [Ponticaulis sp.]